jgi:Flp pilus assembly protein protease CpaA
MLIEQDIMLLITIIIAVVALVIASITDIKKREVPDYVSYGLMFIALAIALIQTVYTWNYIPITQSAMGFVIGIVVAYAMFYLGQWGGGDSKLMMGLGAVIGFNAFDLFGEKNYWLLILLVNIVLIGALYGLAWSIALAIKNRKQFIKGMNAWLKKRWIQIIRTILIILIVLMLLMVFTLVPVEYRSILLLSLTSLYIIFYVWLFVKVIEETCMIKKVPISKLTEGDWIYEEVYIGKKLITGPKDLGISREQISELKKYAAKGKISTVTIKEGIPFIPVFLLAYISTIILYYYGLF